MRIVIARALFQLPVRSLSSG